MFFSVVIPTYNRAKVLPKTIQSVCNQSFQDWEMIIVDDGSTDDTPEILDSYIQKEQRIRFLSRPDSREKGANACRNIGIENAKGDYIAMLDSDDEWRPQRLENVFHFLEDNQFDGIYSQAMTWDGKKIIPGHTRDFKSEETSVDFVFDRETSASTPTLVFRRDHGLNIKWDETLQRHQDIDFFIRFGDNYSWKYFDDENVIINWDQNRLVNIHFESLIKFYKKFGESASDKSVLSEYLFSNWILAERYERKYKSFYAKEIRRLGWNIPFKYWLFSRFPNVFYSIWHLLKYRKPSNHSRRK